MNRFIIKQSIAHFEDLLTTDLDPKRRATILKLLVIHMNMHGEYSIEHVAKVDRHIARIDGLIAQQRQRVDHLNGDGRAASSAEKLLDILTYTKELYQQHRASVLKDRVCADA